MMGPFRQPSVRIVGTRRSALDLARGRMVALGVFFSLAWILIAVRVFDLTVIQATKEPGSAQSVVEVSAAFEEPESAAADIPSDKSLRADIVDRNGVLLATSLRTASLYADQLVIQDPAVLARVLHTVFPDTSAKAFGERLKGRKRFAWVRRNLTPEEQQKILDIGEPGLDFQEEPRRIYPQGPLAAHVVGYGDVDGSGLAGIERAFESRLERGEPVRLSLDVRIQHALRREIATAMADFKARGGSGVVMDVRTGEILGAVSLPDFDPHLPGKASDDRRRNRVTLDVLELGSMFKIFSTAAVLELRKLPMGSELDATKPIHRYGYTISDYHPERRPLTVPEIFMHSSNIGAALMGEMVGTTGLKDFYGRLGLTSKLDLEIPETGAPLLPHPWRDINTLTASYGHGIAVSPMQLAAATATLVGDGRYVAPTLLAVDDRSSAPKTGPRAASRETVGKMRALMRLVVTDGTGTNAEVRGYRVGGKTGTAEMSVSGGYDTSRLISSFVGAFPIDDPRYVVLAVVEEPKPNARSYGYATGGWVAAPAVGRIVAAMGSILGLDVPLKTPGKDPAEHLRRYLHENPPVVRAPVLDPVPQPARPTKPDMEAHLAAN